VGQVSLPGAGQDDHYHLAFILRASGDNVSSTQGSARGDTAKDTFLLGRTAGPVERIFIAYQHNVVDDIHIKHSRNKAGPDP